MSQDLSGTESSFELQVASAYALPYTDEIDALWTKTLRGEEMAVREGVAVLDVHQND